MWNLLFRSNMPPMLTGSTPITGGAKLDFANFSVLEDAKVHGMDESAITAGQAEVFEARLDPFTIFGWRKFGSFGFRDGHSSISIS